MDITTQELFRTKKSRRVFPLAPNAMAFDAECVFENQIARAGRRSFGSKGTEGEDLKHPVERADRLGEAAS